MAFLSWTLMWVEAISGFKVNLEKSALLSMGEVAAVEEFTFELGCKVGSLPTYYEGTHPGFPLLNPRDPPGTPTDLRKHFF